MIPQEFLGIGAGELIFLLVVGVIMFGPEKLPELSRKAARVVHIGRVFARQAMGSLREELGPEYKDLQLSDLNPKTLVRKTLLSEIDGELDDIKRELDGVRSDLSGAATEITHEISSKQISHEVRSDAVADHRGHQPEVFVVRWDDEAT